MIILAKWFLFPHALHVTLHAGQCSRPSPCFRPQYLHACLCLCFVRSCLCFFSLSRLAWPFAPALSLYLGLEALTSCISSSLALCSKDFIWLFEASFAQHMSIHFYSVSFACCSRRFRVLESLMPSTILSRKACRKGIGKNYTTEPIFTVPLHICQPFLLPSVLAC